MSQRRGPQAHSPEGERLRQLMKNPNWISRVEIRGLLYDLIQIRKELARVAPVMDQLQMDVARLTNPNPCFPPPTEELKP